MWFGLMEGGTPVFDLASEPWNTIRKREIKPTRVDILFLKNKVQMVKAIILTAQQNGQDEEERQAG